MLKEEIREGTPVGKQVQAAFERGDLVLLLGAGDIAAVGEAGEPAAG